MDARIPSLLPEQFGPLQGVRILSTGTLIAAPFAAALAAELGAEVVHTERPGEGDTWRMLGATVKTKSNSTINSAWIQERRNTFHTTLDLGTTEGRDLFL
ncbi:MAG: CoA transferase, partial [Dehalococcoidia bacterium]